MKKVRSTVLATVIITLLGSLLSLLVPLPAAVNAFDFYFNFSLSIATILLYIGGSVAIVMGFGAFTDKLRRPYTILFTGLIIWGLSYLQLPLLMLLNRLDDNLFLSISAVPYIGSSLLVFVGTRMLARTFNVTSIATRWLFVLGALVATSVLVVVVPHGYTPSKEADFDAANVLLTAATTLFGLGAYNILRVKRQASVAFINPLAWLSLSMSLSFAVAGVGSTVLALIFGNSTNGIVLATAVAPSALAAVLFVRSAYSFNKIVVSADAQGLSVARSFFGKPLTPLTKTQISSVDIVTYTASLASQPREIDEILDEVRLITSRARTDESMNATDNERLLQVYLKVEQYLLTKETVRVFTKDSLRQDIAQKLHLTAQSSGTFWPKLSGA